MKRAGRPRGSLKTSVSFYRLSEGTVLLQTVLDEGAEKKPPAKSAAKCEVQEQDQRVTWDLCGQMCLMGL